MLQRLIRIAPDENQGGAAGAETQPKGLTDEIKTYEDAQKIYKTPEELIEAAKVDGTAELIEAIKSGTGLIAIKDAGGDIDALFKAVDDFRKTNNPPPPTPPPPPDDLQKRAEALAAQKNISVDAALKELQTPPPPPPPPPPPITDKDKIEIEKLAQLKGITYEEAKIQFNAQKVIRENEIQHQIDAEIDTATKPYAQFLNEKNQTVFENEMVKVAQEVVKGGHAPNWTEIAKDVAEALFGPTIANMTGQKLVDIVKISSKEASTALGNRGSAAPGAIERLNKAAETRGVQRSRIQTYERNDKRM